MIIEPLADHPEVLPTLAEWYLAEWQPYYGDGGPGDARQDLLSRCNRNGIPVALVAIDGGQVCGTIALDRDAATNLSPSVVGLLVGHGYRKRGVGSNLLAAAEDLARELGHSQVYLSTTILGSLLERRGWHFVNTVEFVNETTGSVYVCEL